MTSSDGATVMYAYGVVRAGFGTSGAPRGLGDAEVRVMPAGPFAVLVSELPASEYAADTVERRSGEVHWLSPRAMAHDRVLTWAQEHGGVVPMPMFSLWADGDALSASIAGRQAELERVFARVAGADEFGLRLHRREAEMLAGAAALDPDLVALRSEAAAAPPGQRYLLERKLADRSRAAAKAVSQRIAKDVFETLRGLSREALARPLVPNQSAAAEATMVLNGAFLVDRARLDAFRAAVAALVREHEPTGLAFDFTGPWPPYNFSA